MRGRGGLDLMKIASVMRWGGRGGWGEDGEKGGGGGGRERAGRREEVGETRQEAKGSPEGE